jgi:HK97 family phage prohead protease
MKPLINTRGHLGGLCTRRSADWQVPDAFGGMQLRADVKDDGSGAFEGWACVYGIKDSYGTTFQAGAFTRGGLDPSPYALLWMHNAFVPLGTFAAEDKPEGLWIAGEFDPTPEGQTARARGLSGSAPELSVGFVWLADGGEDDQDLIVDARLVETSQITLRMAAVPGAAFQQVREDDHTDLLATLEAAEASALQADARSRAAIALRLVQAGL